MELERVRMTICPKQAFYRRGSRDAQSNCGLRPRDPGASAGLTDEAHLLSHGPACSAHLFFFFYLKISSNLGLRNWNINHSSLRNSKSVEISCFSTVSSWNLLRHCGSEITGPPGGSTTALCTLSCTLKGTGSFKKYGCLHLTGRGFDFFNLETRFQWDLWKTFLVGFIVQPNGEPLPGLQRRRPAARASAMGSTRGLPQQPGLLCIAQSMRWRIGTVCFYSWNIF